MATPSSAVRCPLCGGEVYLITCDYGFGYGTEYRCYNGSAHRGEYSFSVKTPEAKAESDASRGSSRSNAQAYAREHDLPVPPAFQPDDDFGLKPGRRDG